MKKILVHGDNKSENGYHMIIGRFQPFHDGHKWLVQQCLDENKKVLICIRDVKPNENNPLSPREVESEIKKIYWRYLTDEKVKVMIIPDIQSVTFGRSVGYDITEFEPPEIIKSISATNIRKGI